MGRGWRRVLDDSGEVREVAAKLKRYVAQKNTGQGDNIYSIDVDQYTDQVRFEDEKEKILRQTPILGALSSEVAANGAYKSIDIAQIPVVRDCASLVRSDAKSAGSREEPFLAGLMASSFNRLPHMWSAIAHLAFRKLQFPILSHKTRRIFIYLKLQLMLPI